MFDVAPTELLLVAIVALVVIGPKDLPKAMRFVGFWVGRARGVMRQFRSGFDTMVREAELEEMEKKWAAENARIMSEHPQPSSLPAPEPQVIEHDDGEAPPVMVEQPAFASDPPPVLPAPIAIDAAVVEPSPALAPAATPTPAPAPAADLFASEPAVIATPDGDDAAPVKKPRKRKAAS